MQITDTIMMIRPVKFSFNPSTAEDNVYQHENKRGLSDVDISKQAILEFDNFIGVLKSAGVRVIEFQDDAQNHTPDSIFPNNWISTHIDGSVWLYPMLSINRRSERRKDIVHYLQNNFHVSKIFNDAVAYENNNQFLEGTGSMVLDRENKIAYASISKRTNELLFKDWCKKMNFEAVCFQAEDAGKPIYHTNVLMSVCQNMVLICLDAICNLIDKENLISLFNKTGKQVIKISKEQMNGFLGNVLELNAQNDQSILVMSSSAFHLLTASQKDKINQHCNIVHSSLNAIEYFGGGSARCMITELFLKSHDSDKFKYPILS